MANTLTPMSALVPLDDQVACVVREIGMRERVYPAWVSAKKMSQAKSDHEMAAMRAVLVTVNDYQAMQPKVLAISTVCITLARRLGIEQDDLDALLTRAEETAKSELEKTHRDPDDTVPG